MDLGQASAYRKLAGKACALFFLLAFFAILDGLVAKFREPANVLHLLPGDAVEINGYLPENIKKTDELTYDSNSPDLRVAFEAIHSGYYLGGNMWRGRLSVGRNLSPGKYIISVRPKELPPNKPGFQFRVVVHQDILSQRAAYRSIIRRLTGRSPYLVAAAFLPLIGITMGLIFLLSRRIEVLQAESGLAEIYQVARGEGNYLVAFGLGHKHGLNPGDQVTLLDPDGNYVGSAVVDRTSDTDSVALASIAQEIKPGYLVSRN
jgi:hypothetical protein